MKIYISPYLVSKSYMLSSIIMVLTVVKRKKKITDFFFLQVIAGIPRAVTAEQQALSQWSHSPFKDTLA